MDELIEIVALCPAGADVQELPSPPVETVSCGRTRWCGLFTRNVDVLAQDLRGERSGWCMPWTVRAGRSRRSWGAWPG